MTTNFSVDRYMEGLRTLFERQGVNVTVKGFEYERDWERFEGPLVEFTDESFVSVGGAPALRKWDAMMTANLIVMVRTDEAGAEKSAVELALDVATALVDETGDEDDTAPVFGAIGGAPINVLRVEPYIPEGALQNRVACRMVTFEQGVRIERANQFPAPTEIKRVYIGRAPEVGPDHLADYRLLLGVD